MTTTPATTTKSTRRVSACSEVAVRHQEEGRQRGCGICSVGRTSLALVEVLAQAQILHLRLMELLRARREEVHLSLLKPATQWESTCPKWGSMASSRGTSSSTNRSTIACSPAARSPTRSQTVFLLAKRLLVFLPPPRPRPSRPTRSTRVERTNETKTSISTSRTVKAKRRHCWCQNGSGPIRGALVRLQLRRRGCSHRRLLQTQEQARKQLVRACTRAPRPLAATTLQDPRARNSFASSPQTRRKATAATAA
mmetsp:Transcript_16444/g.40671  ORF Transcript_16444/g.40671 Transcript_16444/m.40671 type:complete len:253 (+) Transcript_16444:2894-3652(+)